jgi:FlaA1/EpsC-like NDP-sugar epimerase
MTIIGMRPGEKMNEVLVSEEEMWRATELENYYIIPSWAKSQDKEGTNGINISEYTSAVTHQLTQEEILEMLEADGWFGPDAKAKAAHGVEIHDSEALSYSAVQSLSCS